MGVPLYRWMVYLKFISGKNPSRNMDDDWYWLTTLNQNHIHISGVSYLGYKIIWLPPRYFHDPYPYHFRLGPYLKNIGGKNHTNWKTVATRRSSFKKQPLSLSSLPDVHVCFVFCLYVFLWSFPKSEVFPKIIQVMDDHFTHETIWNLWFLGILHLRKAKYLPDSLRWKPEWRHGPRWLFMIPQGGCQTHHLTYG